MTQPTLFDPNPEIAARDQALATHERTKAGYLAQVRAEMVLVYRRLAAEDPEAWVCADDARVYFEGLPDVPGPAELSRNFLGQTFLDGRWEAVGFVRSRTVGSHGNRLVKWRLK